jgi:hypothetical protein
MMATAALGTFIAGGASSKWNATAHTTTIGSALQVVGYGLMSTLGQDTLASAKTYGFEVLLGLGFGMSVTSTTIMVFLRHFKQPEHTGESQCHVMRTVLMDSSAVLQGCLTQMRTLGGCIGLAIGAIVLNTRVSNSAVLAYAITASERELLYKSPLVIAELSPAQQRLVAGVYATAFTEQMRLCTCVGGAAFLTSLLTIERHPPPPASKQGVSDRDDVSNARPEMMVQRPPVKDSEGDEK